MHRPLQCSHEEQPTFVLFSRGTTDLCRVLLRNDRRSPSSHKVRPAFRVFSRGTTDLCCVLTSNDRSLTRSHKERPTFAVFSLGTTFLCRFLTKNDRPLPRSHEDHGLNFSRNSALVLFHSSETYFMALYECRICIVRTYCLILTTSYYTDVIGVLPMCHTPATGAA